MNFLLYWIPMSFVIALFLPVVIFAKIVNLFVSVPVEGTSNVFDGAFEGWENVKAEMLAVSRSPQKFSGSSSIPSHGAVDNFYNPYNHKTVAAPTPVKPTPIKSAPVSMSTQLPEVSFADLFLNLWGRYRSYKANSLFWDQCEYFERENRKGRGS